MGSLSCLIAGTGFYLKRLQALELEMCQQTSLGVD
jgi:hypothetical protein